MSGLFGAIESGKLALFAQQAAMQVLNQNVANAGTPGYSRRQMILGARALLGDMGYTGGGVEVLGMQRMTDVFLLGQMGRAMSDQGEQASLRDGYGVLELLIGEPADETLGETSLGDSINSFLSSWQEAINPESESGGADLREVILESARSLARRFNTLAGGIEEEAASLRTAISGQVGEVNRLLSEVAELNTQITQSGIDDGARASLEDAREMKLMRLSELAGAEWNQEDDGTVSVFISGRQVASGNSWHALTLEDRGEPADRLRGLALRVDGESGLLQLGGGAIRGKMTLLNNDIPDTLGRLDELAEKLVESVNAVHQQASGDGGGGIDIFSGTDASSIALNTSLENNPELLSVNGLLPDGSDIATAMFALHEQSVDDATGRSLEGLWASIVGDVGSRSQSAIRLSGAAESLVFGLEQRQAAVSGVNLDEELASMMIYQTAYTAASRVLGTLDEMLETLVETF